ncbi:MAG: hypothetical protein COX65_02780 [Elusimicrobia bacterium CG_4_10_14_0_2_um_filter_56_8]|nr:MAG: hypothetical protein AUJ51_05240 [Elusimicrobia bacterium CG1_02_56_21]PJA16302.1 MAG: hypothetical protein COX65_02780 [Elusimicrobia bacterium CG_4_10_14_0_2_um_filter_56_8]
MKSVLIVLVLLLPAYAAASPSAFKGSRVNGAGVTYLEAAPVYDQLSLTAKAAEVAIAVKELGLTSGRLVVKQEAAGELWTIKAGTPSRLDAWSDKSLPLGQNANPAGRWFASFGMQGMSGGDYPSGAINMRLGSTLYKNRYDVALTYDYYKLRDALEGRTSLGLVGRALMPVSPYGGWNIGAQLLNVNNYGVRQGTLGIVAGINVFLPRGSFDITLNLQDQGNYGLLAGYTVFITR